ncbi:unnamed protein product [Paramecium sonneborni]|uniref:Uncharacterized protein n=1 Tax=Paramecium sonneborni TaxID=65129 RepID=A0A8S1PEE9_9CILI|nr:unnamed protein product [Paramecium sonneborni]
MNNNSNTKLDVLPKLMTSYNKLLEPAYLKNSQIKMNQNESKLLPIIQRSSMMQPNVSSKQLIVQRLISNLEFSSRHFGAACDRGFQGLSKYHYSQKFGHSAAKLEPLNRNIIAELTDTEDAEEIPKDERTYYKRIYKFKNMPILALIKSFEIEWIREFEDEVNKKSSKSLQLSFQNALAILNTFSDPLEFFQKNLQLLERNSVALKQKGLTQLKYKVKSFEQEEFQRLIVIKNQSGLGYFRINFPTIQLYQQEYSHNQTIDLSPIRLYEIVKNNFFEMTTIVEQFDFDKFQLYVSNQNKEIQEQLDEPNIKQNSNILKAEEQQPSIQNQQQDKNGEQESQKQLQNIEQTKNQYQEQDQVQTQQQQQEQGKQQEYNLLNNISNTDLSIIIIDEKQEFPEKILQKRWIKKVVPKDNKYYTVDFLPFQILVREKRSQKIIKMYSPSLKELDFIFLQLNSKSLFQILNDYVLITFDMPPEAFDYKDFKKGTKISFQIGEITESPLEVTEEQINNGLLDSWTKEIEVNNKDLQIIIEPCMLEIYYQLTSSTIKRPCTSKELTHILEKRYLIGFRLI